MPLDYDNIDGSWGRKSMDWPRLEGTQIELDLAYLACSKEHVVPYGSFVMHETFLSIETEELLEKLKSHLSTSRKRIAIMHMPVFGGVPVHQKTWKERVAEIPGRKIDRMLAGEIDMMIRELEREKAIWQGRLHEEEWEALFTLREYKKQIEAKWVP